MRPDHSGCFAVPTGLTKLCKGGANADAPVFLPTRIEAMQKFLTRENLGFIKTGFERPGLLSIDADGNDY
jgi:hypothetical protein